MEAQQCSSAHSVRQLLHRTRSDARSARPKAPMRGWGTAAALSPVRRSAKHPGRATNMGTSKGVSEEATTARFSVWHGPLNELVELGG